jgi:hypothetical protein
MGKQRKLSIVRAHVEHGSRPLPLSEQVFQDGLIIEVEPRRINVPHIVFGIQE